MVGQQETQSFLLLRGKKGIKKKYFILFSVLCLLCCNFKKKKNLKIDILEGFQKEKWSQRLKRICKYIRDKRDLVVNLVAQSKLSSRRHSVKTSILLTDALEGYHKSREKNRLFSFSLLFHRIIFNKFTELS